MADDDKECPKCGKMMSECGCNMKSESGEEPQSMSPMAAVGDDYNKMIKAKYGIGR